MNPSTHAAYVLLENAHRLALDGLRATDPDSEAAPYAQAYYTFIKDAWDNVRNYESPEDKFCNDMFMEQLKAES